VAWFDDHGRHDLPWQADRTPYRVWVSEIMLQQTQVQTVIPYFERFTSRFPDIASLADADQDEVLHYWTGLGYYARGRNLHRASRMIRDELGNVFPSTLHALRQLPGVGRSTAGAIAAIAFHQPSPILDGNVKRVLSRFHAVPGYPGERAVERKLWRLAESHTYPRRIAAYTQAIMDLGATLCTRANPECDACPLHDGCEARRMNAQAQFPAPRPKKIRPHKEVTAFVLVDPDAACLLEKRPEQGIWGGLWCPPERARDVSVESFLDHHGIGMADVQRIEHAPTLHHGFTHFSMDVRPVYIWLARHPRLAPNDDTLCWYHPRSTNQILGLSAVAVKLLDCVSNEEFALT
jgi:A/G-specific adenine glycosylase